MEDFFKSVSFSSKFSRKSVMIYGFFITIKNRPNLRSIFNLNRKPKRKTILHLSLRGQRGSAFAGDN